MLQQLRVDIDIRAEVSTSAVLTIVDLCFLTGVLILGSEISRITADKSLSLETRNSNEGLSSNGDNGVWTYIAAIDSRAIVACNPLILVEVPGTMKN